MTTPRPSASLILDDHDSVENDKDFAPLVKKFKVDKDPVHNTDSAIDLDPRTAFSIWCCVNGKFYGDREEEEWRYEVFRQNLDKPIPSSNGKNYPRFADRTEQEFARFRNYFREPDSYSSVSSKELRKHTVFLKPTSPTASMKFTAEEAFQIWRKAYQMEYRDAEELEFRFKMFQEALYLDHPPTYYGVNFPSLADRTKEELKEFGDSLGLLVDNCISHEYLVMIKMYPDD